MAGVNGARGPVEPAAILRVGARRVNGIFASATRMQADRKPSNGTRRSGVQAKERATG